MSTQPAELREPWMLAIHRWVQAASLVPQDRIRWGDSTAPFPSTEDGPWISLRDLGDSPNGREFVETVARLWSFAPMAIDGVDVATNQIAVAQHPFRDGDGPIQLGGTSLPAGLATLVDYWVIRDSASQMRLASSFLNAMAHTAIDITSTGAGPLTIISTARTRRAGSEAEERTMVPFDMELGVQCRGLDAIAVLRRMRSAGNSEVLCRDLHDANVGLLEIGGIQNLGQALNAGNYEPRASMTVRLSVSPRPYIDTITVIETIETEQE